jgi:hypothetical protein
MIDEDKIRAAFERAIASESKSTPYMIGVAQALGWALGEYEDDPTE